jgi:hypothetical protein
MLAFASVAETRDGLKKFKGGSEGAMRPHWSRNADARKGELRAKKLD